VSALPAERILHAILILRGERVLLDSDLATLYGVETRLLVQAVKRNAERFPDDFMFQLSPQEWTNLKSQTVIPSSWGGRRTAPYAFTELGVAMLSSVLNSERAIQANIAIMRAFTQLRGMLAVHSDLARQLEALEKKYDGQFRVVFQAIRDLMEPPPIPKKPIGFRPKK
jgi:hypothetical protein